ncbi:MAG TPA: TetR/AcrR family transcriptional regulator [Gammaproteobacteria bacterium]
MSTPERKVSSESAPASPFTASAQCDSGACARDRLFSAAINLFYRHGIRAVSVDAIAAEAGTTKVTFYRVFESKDDLVVKVLEERSKRFFEWWDAIVAKHPGEPRKQIDELCARFCEEVLADEECRGCAVANAAVEITEEDHPAKAVIAKHKEEKARRLRELCRDMGARQPEMLADALSLLFGGAFSARVANESRAQIATVAAAAAALLDSPLGVPKK